MKYDIYNPLRFVVVRKLLSARSVVKWLAILLLILIFNFAFASFITDYSERQIGEGFQMGDLTAVIVLALYVILLAIPFVPGVEIGISLLIMQGPTIAPVVYQATIAGLTLSYLFGLAFAKSLPCHFLHVMGLPKACVFVDRMKDMDRQGRLSTLEEAAPPWVGNWFIKSRYLLLAILINIPGNSFIGGGGGITMVAGLSRLYSTFGFLLTITLATAPVPMIVFLFGNDLLK